MPADNKNQLYRKISTAGQKNKGIFDKNTAFIGHILRKIPLAMCNHITASKTAGKNQNCTSSVQFQSDIFLNIQHGKKRKNDNIKKR